MRGIVLVSVLTVGWLVAAKAQQPAGRWTLQPEVRIGGASGEGAYELSNVLRIAIGPRGMIAVLEVPGTSIRLFDAEGKYVRTVGRDGAGPGEFRRVGGLGFLGDTLYTLDSGLRRTSLFRLDGMLTQSVQWESTGRALGADRGSFIAAPTALTPDGQALGNAVTSADAAASGRVSRLPVLRVSRTGAVTDTLAWYPTRNTHLALRSSNADLYSIQPFGDAPLTVLAGETARVYVVVRDAATSEREATFRVVALSARGDTLWSHAYPYRPIPLPGSVVDSTVTAMAAQFARPGGAPSFSAEQIRGALYVPSFFPPISSAITASDGTLWLQRERVGRSTEWSVIAPSGEPAGTLRLPRSTRIMAATHEVVWGTEVDDADVPTVVRWRITRGR